MKKLLPVLSLSMLLTLSFASAGLAAPYFQDTATPLPTNTPYPTFYPTATDLVYDFPSAFDCPVGTPVGAGTLTPSYFWEFSCGQCLLTPVSTSTSVPIPTVTGTPPTPSPTIPVPTGTPTDCGALPFAGWVSYTRDQTNGVGNSTVSVNMEFCDNASSSTIHCRFHVVQSSTTPSSYTQYGIVTIKFLTTASYSVGAFPEITEIDPGYSNITFEACRTSNGCGTTSYTTSDSWDALTQANALTAPWTDRLEAFGSGYVNGGIRIRSTVKCNDDCRAEYSMDIHLSRGEGCIGHDYVFPTYCSAIETDASEDVIDPGLTWGGVSYGYNACVDIGGWSLSWLGIDYDFPLVRFCMQDVSFAQMTVFGVAVNIDSILYVLVAAWAIRRMITS